MSNPLKDIGRMMVNHRVSGHHVIHVGAHQGQEVSFYRTACIKTITLVEPLPEAASFLSREFYDIDVYPVACSDENAGPRSLYVMDPTYASTLVPPGPDDRVLHKVDVPVVTLRSITGPMKSKPNILVVDVQGKELDVLRGADLDTVHLAVVETSTVHDPTLASGHDEVVDYMESQGFKEAEHWTRTYAEINELLRGVETFNCHGEEVRDVAFVKRNWNGVRRNVH